MSMSSYWDADEQAWVMPSLSALHDDGTAEDWPAFKAELTRRLEADGAGSYAEGLIEPLEEAVLNGADFRTLISELISEYEGFAEEAEYDTEVSAEHHGEEQYGEATVSPTEAEVPPEAQLPDPDELAQQIMMSVGEGIADLMTAEPGLISQLDPEELRAWIIEDVLAEIDEIEKTDLSA